MYGFVHLLGMATRFRKGKLSKIQEKKAKTRLKEGLLTKKRKKDNEPLQEDTVVVSLFPKPAIQLPASPSSSLELITPTDEVIKTRGKDRSVLGTFWGNVDVAVLKAHDAIVVEVISCSQDCAGGPLLLFFFFFCFCFLILLFVSSCWVNPYTSWGNI